mmetsp:Transcript_27008/g.48836  ORF Transcript_27008/g.48836 Transcript_27008/m.48836 type:complete len:83 (-) Transcript_27008:356-604(-)
MASGSVGGSSSQNSTNVKAMLGNPKQSDICLSQGYKETRLEQASNACDPVSPSSTVICVVTPLHCIVHVLFDFVLSCVDKGV